MILMSQQADDHTKADGPGATSATTGGLDPSPIDVKSAHTPGPRMPPPIEQPAAKG